MSNNEINQTDWHDGHENAIETNNPNAPSEYADGKWHKVNKIHRTQATINGKKTTVGVQGFKGYEMNLHAEAKTTKGESTMIGLSIPIGILVGCLVAYAKNLMLGMFLGMAVIFYIVIAVSIKALMRENPDKNKKTAIFLFFLILGILLFIGIIIAALSHFIG